MVGGGTRSAAKKKPAVKPLWGRASRGRGSHESQTAYPAPLFPLSRAPTPKNSGHCRALRASASRRAEAAVRLSSSATASHWLLQYWGEATKKELLSSKAVFGGNLGGGVDSSLRRRTTVRPPRKRQRDDAGTVSILLIILFLNAADTELTVMTSKLLYSLQGGRIVSLLGCLSYLLMGIAAKRYNYSPC
jgi:hypothetical protein